MAEIFGSGAYWISSSYSVRQSFCIAVRSVFISHAVLLSKQSQHGFSIIVEVVQQICRIFLGYLHL